MSMELRNTRVGTGLSQEEVLIDMSAVETDRSITPATDRSLPSGNDTTCTTDRSEAPIDRSPIPSHDNVSQVDPSAETIDRSLIPVVPISLPTSDQFIPVAPIRRSGRESKPPAKLNDYICHTVPTTTLQAECAYPLDQYLSSDRFSPSHCAYLHAITNTILPKHYSQAVLDEHFREDMRSEINACEENQTWTVEELPPGKKAIGCKWVFTIKYRSDGTLERHKARLVVLGNKQIEGEDYDETFAHVSKMTTVRMPLKVSAAKNWEVHQMDVHNAFIHGDLHEKVYMKLPPRFRTNNPYQVCRLHKSLYGLRQSPRFWYEKLSSALVEYGFTQCITDYFLFTFHRDKAQLNVLVRFAGDDRDF